MLAKGTIAPHKAPIVATPAAPANFARHGNADIGVEAIGALHRDADPIGPLQQRPTGKTQRQTARHRQQPTAKSGPIRRKNRCWHAPAQRTTRRKQHEIDQTLDTGPETVAQTEMTAQQHPSAISAKSGSRSRKLHGGSKKNQWKQEHPTSLPETAQPQNQDSPQPIDASPPRRDNRASRKADAPPSARCREAACRSSPLPPRLSAENALAGGTAHRRPGARRSDRLQENVGLIADRRTRASFGQGLHPADRRHATFQGHALDAQLTPVAGTWPVAGLALTNW